MKRDYISIALIVILLLQQWSLWLSSTGWPRVWQLQNELNEKKRDTLVIEQRNSSISTYIQDHRTGMEVMEESARFQLGYIAPDEHYFVYIPSTMNNKNNTSQVLPEPSAKQYNKKVFINE